MHQSMDVGTSDGNRSTVGMGEAARSARMPQPPDAARPRTGDGARQERTLDNLRGYVTRHPLLTVAAAVTVGAAAVIAFKARPRAPDRLEHRALRLVGQMERDVNRELRAIRRSRFADGIGRFGDQVGGAMGGFDLRPFAEQARLYLDAARRRLGG